MNHVKFKSENYINRELSWLEFNRRVLEEAENESTPLLERVKFLAIFSSNLDEFFMVRVAGLREQAFEEGAPQDYNPDGMSSLTQLRTIATLTDRLVQRQYACWNDQIRPKLDETGIRIADATELAGRRKHLDRYFAETVYPILTPLAIDPSHPRPRYHNRALYLAAMLARRTGLGPKKLFAVVQVPSIISRLVPAGGDHPHEFVLLEDLVRSRLPEIFGGFDVECSTTFRVTRDSDVELLHQESDDLLHIIEERLKARRKADAVRLEVPASADQQLVQLIIEQEHVRDEGKKDGTCYSEVYRVPGPLDLTGLVPLTQLQNFDHLRDMPFIPQSPRGLRRREENLFAAIARRDILLHHPFDSFAPVVEFVQRAAADPQVLAIKQTLYRTSGDSPIVRALTDAADSGKHVTAIVELQARFDEQANVGWARQLEQSGVHVVYGFMDLKTHCKVSLVVRQEESGVRRYVHLSTGNYNPTTARVYTDLGLFTADPEIASDVSALLNLLTGYAQGHAWKKLLVAPNDLQRRTLELIEQQASRAQKGKPARIFAKLNSIVDPTIIESLFQASQAGVPIDLIVRGICCLRPGIAGVSDNIRVTSIVDRFLEHSRLFVFGPDESAQIFLSSADWMPRNFYRRVEVMFPIESSGLKKRILSEIIPTYLGDNTRTRQLEPDGHYRNIDAQDGQPKVRCQEELLRLAGMFVDERNAAIQFPPAAILPPKSPTKSRQSDKRSGRSSPSNGATRSVSERSKKPRS
ncbi:MAG: polyphosphate kinase 1 [Planctomycetota bacterium]|nr:polyphosphate kinase 1 [Planctomycetota bacterium]MDA1177187.1 polyphosphate kinase 1 [Planctomycetota bacterium]